MRYGATPSEASNIAELTQDLAWGLSNRFDLIYSRSRPKCVKSIRFSTAQPLEVNQINSFYKAQLLDVYRTDSFLYRTTYSRQVHRIGSFRYRTPATAVSACSVVPCFATGPPRTGGQHHLMYSTHDKMIHMDTVPALGVHQNHSFWYCTSPRGASKYSTSFLILVEP